MTRRTAYTAPLPSPQGGEATAWTNRHTFEKGRRTRQERAHAHMAAGVVVRLPGGRQHNTNS